ncbi:uncharacterized protein LOC133398276 isoform X2 [Phycodurus eques]|uniref:uncharacterized protein LOC133398276 isoform X2 n=1 Tax=Phycodurus eques TaxID=693459 RepID=UPI002ACEB430|nr:uncharacterized protein LOC133398276 isoform X2 [Phycodurus eques]
MWARREAEYGEELCGPKEEMEPQRQRLDVVFNRQPPTVLHRADNEDLLTQWQEPEPPHIKEEEEEEVHPHIKEEEDITKFPSTGDPLKSEDEAQSEESRGAEPPSSSSSQHMTTEADGDHCGGSQAVGLLAPLSDRDNTMSHSSDYDDDDKQSEARFCPTHYQIVTT